MSNKIDKNICNCDDYNGYICKKCIRENAEITSNQWCKIENNKEYEKFELKDKA